MELDKATSERMKGPTRKFLHNIENNWNILCKQLSSLDKQKTDLEHDIEISKLNAVELMKDTIRLRDVLRRRREIKNTMSYLRHVNDIVSKANEAYTNAELDYKVRELHDLKIAAAN